MRLAFPFAPADSGGAAAFQIRYTILRGDGSGPGLANTAAEKRSRPEPPWRRWWRTCERRGTGRENGRPPGTTTPNKAKKESQAWRGKGKLFPLSNRWFASRLSVPTRAPQGRL